MSLFADLVVSPLRDPKSLGAASPARSQSARSNVGGDQCGKPASRAFFLYCAQVHRGRFEGPCAQKLYYCLVAAPVSSVHVLPILESRADLEGDPPTCAPHTSAFLRPQAESKRGIAELLPLLGAPTGDRN